VVFGDKQNYFRWCFLSPELVILDIQKMMIPSGVAVLCVPFNHPHHQL